MAEYDGVVPPSLLIFRSGTGVYLAIVDFRQIATSIIHGVSRKFRVNGQFFPLRLSDLNSKMLWHLSSVSCLVLLNAEPSPTLRTLSSLYWPTLLACAVRNGRAETKKVSTSIHKLLYQRISTGATGDISLPTESDEGAALERKGHPGSIFRIPYVEGEPKTYCKLHQDSP